MTIREFLTCKSRRNMLAGFLAWGAFAISIFTAPILNTPLLPLAFFLPFIGCVFAQAFFVRCPKCNGNLGLLLAQSMSLLTLMFQANHCPFCGIDFNEDHHP
jgi:hypothetical protein